MVDIISKKTGPRREDVAAKKLIKQNRSVIESLANHLSGGSYSTMRQPPKPPELSGFILHDQVDRKKAKVEGRAYIRISPNDRVVLVDQETGKQLQFLGAIRRGPAGQRFVLATKENGFFSPLEDALSAKLAEIDQRLIGADCSEEDLATEIGVRLGLV